jgi:hypothetical protein
MKATAIHKGENMHATLSFAYPDDEQKLKDALAGEKYRVALRNIQDRIAEMYEHDDDPEFVINSIKTTVEFALKEEL